MGFRHLSHCRATKALASLRAQTRQSLRSSDTRNIDVDEDSNQTRDN